MAKGIRIPKIKTKPKGEVKRGRKSKRGRKKKVVTPTVKKKKELKKTIRKNTPKENRGKVAKLAREQEADRLESSGMTSKKGGRGINENAKSLHEYDTREWNASEKKAGSAEPSGSVREAQQGGRYDSADEMYDGNSMRELEKELKGHGGFEIISKAHGGQVRGWGKARRKK